MDDFLYDREWSFFDPEEQSLKLKKGVQSYTDLLNAVIEEICEVVELTDRHSSSRTIPIQRPKSYLKRLIYQLVAQAIDTQRELILRQNLVTKIQDAGGRWQNNQNQVGSDNLFHLALRSIRIDSVPIIGGELTRTARDLEFAYENDVPQEYLIGFIYQSGGAKPVPQTKIMKSKEDEEWENVDDPQDDFDEFGEYIRDLAEKREAKETSNEDWDD